MRGAGNTARLVGLPAAAGPIEASGRRRDEARLLVVGPSSVVDTTFGAVGEFLAPGDVLVVNTSGTLAAALPVQGPAFGRGGPEGLLLHLGTELPGGLRLVELRTATGFGSAPFGDTRPGAVRLPGGGRADLLSPWPATAAPSRGPDAFSGRATTPAEGPARLWVARLDVPGDPLIWLADHGRPIRYGEPAEPWSIANYQTVFATEPGSAEMPSAARGFTAELVTALVSSGVVIAPLLLHCGVSSPEAGEAPQPERYRVPAGTAALVNAARAAGRRVVAVGTTAVRALETVADETGTVHPGQGWTELVISPDRGVRAVDALVTGWHEPEASHLELIAAVAGPELIERSYSTAHALGYHGHEFGDFHLLLPGGHPLP
ncbi:MAG TPA: S-adenosylmethionine:tRNA ribosyltransferase-isomerase [Acidimicrobiia bacterium]|nr:S-adenosylmethionine:tRNA ribosyltransferase-isomerase [Acidimicrobiia bacterium]